MQEYVRSLRHELRTPLNHIVGYSELLLDAADDTGQHHLIPDLQCACRAMVSRACARASWLSDLAPSFMVCPLSASDGHPRAESESRACRARARDDL